MKRITLLAFFMVQFTFGNAIIWSKTGHRTVGEVAQQHLKGRAKRAIKKILKGESLALVSTFADEIKADRSYSHFSPWHYVNFPADKKYTDVSPSPKGDLITGIRKCIAIIKDKNSSDADKNFYLKMLVHLVGDLHQPLHAGQAEDKGGNDIQLQWFGEGTNLHRLWDSNLINSFGMGYTELAKNLPPVKKRERKKIQSGSILTWVQESKLLANELYKSVEIGEEVGYQYSYKYTDLVRSQLQKGGLRLAKILNDLF
ncbi:S1/P1 nuclease [Spongiimicrobium salis]|uniref:S1/P1 nuclease n=1 Tax=Spongiimicrobium salis TaxID=1667022 RepID=UPI00374CB461